MWLGIHCLHTLFIYTVSVNICFKEGVVLLADKFKGASLGLGSLDLSYSIHFFIQLPGYVSIYDKDFDEATLDILFLSRLVISFQPNIIYTTLFTNTI